MAERECYARGQASMNEPRRCEEHPGLDCTTEVVVECHPGLELRPGDDVDELTRAIQHLAVDALARWGANHLEVVRQVEEGIKERWPGRAYFIETEESGRGVQVYQPFGMPRHPDIHDVD